MEREALTEAKMAWSREQEDQQAYLALGTDDHDAEETALVAAVKAEMTAKVAMNEEAGRAKEATVPVVVAAAEEDAVDKAVTKRREWSQWAANAARERLALG